MLVIVVVVIVVVVVVVVVSAPISVVILAPILGQQNVRIMNDVILRCSVADTDSHGSTSFWEAGSGSASK